MQAKEESGFSVSTVPLLVDYDHSNKHEFCDAEKAEGNKSVINLKFSIGNSSFLNTTFNGLNAMSGVGILSIPYALSSGGWLSLILLFIIGMATFYTGILIKKCMQVDPNFTSYPDIGHKAFGEKGRIIISIFIHVELYLIAVGFLILAGDNLHKFLPNFEANVIFGIQIGGSRSFIVFTALIMMPTVLINKMSTLSYLSTTGVVASMVVLLAVLWSGISNGIGFQQKGVLLNWSGLPTAISLYTVSFYAHSLFPTLYTSMKSPRQFSWVLFVCFLFSGVTCASMAITGYLMFGSKVKSEITLNLPTDSFISKVAIFTALINPISRYALMLKPIVDTIETRFQSYFGKRLYSLIFRITLVSVTLIVAIFVPFFGYLMSLIGAFLSVTASILFPCLCYLKISGDYRRLSFELVIIGFILLMGIVIMVFGTYTSLLQIIQNL